MLHERGIGRLVGEVSGPVPHEIRGIHYPGVASRTIGDGDDARIDVGQGQGVRTIAALLESDAARCGTEEPILLGLGSVATRLPSYSREGEDDTRDDRAQRGVLRLPRLIAQCAGGHGNRRTRMPFSLRDPLA